MTTVEILLSVGLGLVVNEFSDVSPWLARWLVRWSARLRYGETVRAEIRAEELAAVINDRPGKLFKLGTGIRFASAALATRVRRALGGEPATDHAPDEVVPAGQFLEAEPSSVVAPYMFPTEKFRGEWHRHWIHLAKSLAVTALYAVCGTWAAAERIRPQYRAWTIAAIILGSVLFAGYRTVGWWYERFIITNKRLMVQSGLLARRVAMVPLSRVTDLRYSQTVLSRVLNYGEFTLESMGRGSSLRRIAHLPNPNELYLRIVEEMYEPAAVDSRLASLHAETEPPTVEPVTTPAATTPAATAGDGVTGEGPPAVGALSEQLAALTVAVSELTLALNASAATAGRPTPVPAGSDEPGSAPRRGTRARRPPVTPRPRSEPG